MRRSVAFGLFALLASSSTASFADPSADASPWYVGLATNHNDYGSLPEADSDIPGTSHHANGWAVLGGYQVNPWFGWELSSFDLGAVSAHSRGMPSPGYNVSLASKPELTGESIDAVFKLDLWQGFFVFGKGGLTASSLRIPWDATTTSIHGTAVNVETDSISSTVRDYGVGLGYEAESGWALRLGWTQYREVGGTGGIDLATFGTLGGRGNVNSLHLDLLFHSASSSTPVFSDTSPWYVGFAVNRNDYGSLPQASSDIPGTFHHAMGWSVLVGNQINPWVGLEASYFDLGSVSAHQETYTGGMATRPKLTGTSLDIVLKTDLRPRFFLFGKGGLTLSTLHEPEVDTNIYPSGTSVYSTYSSIDSAVFEYGLGLGYDTESGWTLRLGWTRYLNVGNTAEYDNGTALYGNLTGQGNVNSLHLDLIYRL